MGEREGGRDPKNDDLDFAAAAAAPIIPVVKKKTPGNMNIITIIVLSSIILTLIAAGAAGILWTRISEVCRKPQVISSPSCFSNQFYLKSEANDLPWIRLNCRRL